MSKTAVFRAFFLGWLFVYATAAEAQTQLDEKLYNGLKWRSIGPYRGGRSCAVTGVVGQPNVFYFGGTGGGVWKSTDAGASWTNVSDRFFGGSIGAVAVSESDPNVIYVGGGEKTLRGNLSHGYGVWKSLDAGKTWKSMGLIDTRHISRIRIHPKNPDLVYVAAIGHAFGPNPERGVFRSKDGGKTWEKVLFVSNDVGAVDLVLDPSNPRIIYASTWRVRRTPYSFESGGEGSALWKSTDGGDTWQNISQNEGLPKGTLGIIGVTVSPVNPERVWAIIEAEEGGVFRSDDGGKKWIKLNSDRSLRQRAWYYTRIYADTKNPDMVYVVNVEFHRSKDGGKTFTTIPTPHGDHHDLWIDPNDPNRMIIGDDGGAQVTLDGGENWSTYHNQPTAQFYRVITDNSFPYRIYVAQQDNSTLRIRHRSEGYAITEADWEETAGGESGHIAVDPRDNDIVYGGSYGGLLERFNHRTKERRLINVYPDNPMGHGAEGMKYRFQWNFPIFFSPHDPSTLYAASNILFKTTNEGQSWEAISPDLTRNDKSKLGPSGGSITKDNTGVEYYCTIFAAAESPIEKGVIWCGSDDGLIHVTRDGGRTWTNVTPKDLPEWTMINSIEINPHEKGSVYVAATRYKLDDFAPYIYKTTDYGKTWRRIVKGINKEHFTRVVRCDPVRKGLLFAGTESGVYISFDDGENWSPFQLNLPIVPITDMTIKDSDLIVSTQGRSIWLIDDISPLRELTPEVAKKDLHLYTPRPTVRMEGSRPEKQPKGMGENLQAGVLFTFYLKDEPDSAKPVKLEIFEANGKLIRTFSSHAKEKSDRLEAKAGSNRFTWNMFYPDAERFEGLVLWAGGTQGPKAVPGRYEARLSFAGKTEKVAFEIIKDPRIKATQKDLEEQFEFLIAIRDKLSETHVAIKQIRDIREQINALTKRLSKDEAKEIYAAATELTNKLTKIEEALYQTKNRSSQDPLNFPIRLNNKLSSLASLAGRGDYKPTDQMMVVRNELVRQIDEELAALKTLLEKDVPTFNELVRQKAVPSVIIKQKPQSAVGSN